MDFLIPLAIVLLGVIAMTIYVLVIALRETTRQLVSMNEQLLVLAGVKDGGEGVARALIASARKPKNEQLGGVVKSPAEKVPQKGLTFTVGNT